MRLHLTGYCSLICEAPLWRRCAKRGTGTTRRFCGPQHLQLIVSRCNPHIPYNGADGCSRPSPAGRSRARACSPIFSNSVCAW